MDFLARDTLFCLYDEVSYPGRNRSCATAADTVREECDERAGDHRENEAGEDRDPLQDGIPRLRSQAESGRGKQRMRATLFDWHNRRRQIQAIRRTTGKTWDELGTTHHGSAGCNE